MDFHIIVRHYTMNGTLCSSTAALLSFLYSSISQHILSPPYTTFTALLTLSMSQFSPSVYRAPHLRRLPCLSRRVRGLRHHGPSSKCREGVWSALTNRDSRPGFALPWCHLCRLLESNVGSDRKRPSGGVTSAQDDTDTSVDVE